MNERDIERRLVRLAKLYGWYCRKIRFVGHNGAPDRLLITPNGTLCFVELKAPGKKPTALQVAEHQRLRSYKQLVAVIDSIEDVEELFA